MNNVPSSTHRVVFPEAKVVKVEEAPLPPISSGDIRVRTHWSLISSGTECANLLGPPWQQADGSRMPKYPCTSGYSNAGEIIEVGEAVESWKVGDRVASSAPHIGIAALRPSQPKWLIPDGVSFKEATFTTLAATVLNGVRLGQPQLGEVAVIIGLGILGQLASQFVRLFGAETVIGVDLDDFRLNAARKSGGITDAVNPNDTDPRDAVSDLSEGRGADVVYEVTGLTDTFNLAFDLAKTKGRVVALGSPRWPAPVDMMKLHLKAIHLIGAIVSSHPQPGNEDNRWTRQANGNLFLRLVRDGKMNVTSLITHRYDSHAATEAFDLLTRKVEPAIGVLLKWE